MMLVDTRFPSHVLDAIAKLLRNLPDEIEGADLSEHLMLALDHVDAARAAIELHLEHMEK